MATVVQDADAGTVIVRPSEIESPPNPVVNPPDMFDDDDDAGWTPIIPMKTFVERYCTYACARGKRRVFVTDMGASTMFKMTVFRVTR